MNENKTNNFKLNNLTRSLLIIITGVVILIAVILVDNRLHPTYNLKRMTISDRKYDTITTSLNLVDGALNTNLYLGNQPMIYDAVDNTFYYSLTANDEDLIVTLSEGTKAKLALYQQGDNKLIQYTSDSVSISNLVATTLPIMNITVSADTVIALGLDETYAIAEDTGAGMYLYDNREDFEDKSRAISSDIKIRMRGGTTIDAPQKSYRLTLLKDQEDFDKTEKEDLLGLRKDDDWILYSAYSDYEKIRNVFSMNLWHEMEPISNEYKYIELFFNGRYHGLYALTYPIDKKVFDIKEGEALFKKKDWAPSEFSYELEYQEFEDGSGGYPLLPGYSIKAGDISSYDILHELYYNLAYSGDPDIIRQSADIDNSIDLWLFYKITQAVDNVYADAVKNLFTATKLSEVGYHGYQLYFCPWDMDQTWGNRFVEGEGTHGITSYYNPTDYDLPMFWSPVYFLMESGDTDIFNQVKTRYIQLREGILSDESIKDTLASYEADIHDSGAYERTINRWPDGNYYDPHAKLDDFESYVLERMKYMDAYIASLN